MLCNSFLIIAGLFFDFTGTFAEVTAKNDCRLAQSDSCLSDSKAEGSILHMESSHRPWITQIMSEVENNFYIANFDGVSSACKEDIDILKLHLRNSSVWAIRMLESTEWPRTRILAGTTHHLGNYDDCLMVSYRKIRGQYCLVQADYDFVSDDGSKIYSLDLPIEESSARWAVKISQYYNCPMRKNRRQLKWAMCIPSSCKNADLEASLHSSLSSAFRKHDINIIVKVDPDQCRVKDMKNPPEYYYTRNAFYIILALVVLASGYELAIKEKWCEGRRGLLMELFLGFSVIENYRKLKNYTPSNEFMFIHAQKVIFMTLVVSVHRLIYLYAQLFVAEQFESNHYLFIFMETHLPVVDLFFFFGGFLMFHSNNSKFYVKGGTQIVLSVINRWLRLIPPFAAVILFFVHIFPYIIDGPLRYTMTNELELCKSNWLYAVLAVNNIINPDKLCFWVSWFISADFQLTIVGSIIVLILVKRKTLGVLTLVSTVIISMVVTYNYVIQNNCYGVLRLIPTNSPIVRSAINEFYGIYVTLAPRVGPYLIGIGSAFVAKLLKDRKFKFSKMHIIIAAVSTLIIGEWGGALYGYVFAENNRRYDPVEHAIFAAVHRSLFVIPYAYINCMYLVNGFKPIENLISGMFVILDRLGYSVYLINTVIYHYSLVSQRVLYEVPDCLGVLCEFVSNSMLLYSAAFLFHLLIEAPCGNIAKLIVQQLSRVLEIRNEKSSNVLKNSTRSKKE